MALLQLSRFEEILYIRIFPSFLKRLIIQNLVIDDEIYIMYLYLVF